MLRLKNRVQKRSKAFVHEIGRILYEEVKEVTGKRYYSLGALRRLGHPYAVRWPVNYLMDDRIINKQSGKLHRSIRYQTRATPKGATINVWASVPYVKELVNGNELQRPRPFFNLALENAKRRMDEAQRRFVDGI